jgi:tetratricopeptide (TPR) repeat protein
VLPAPDAGFVGRERELAELRAEIARPGLAVAGGREADRGRVLLVVGRPGIGRTSVALELARQVRGDYPDGAFFLRLTADGGRPAPPEQSARTLLRALGVRQLSEADPVEALRAAVHGKRLLLVLDDSRPGDGLADLLPRSPGSLVVATSDGPLPGVPDVRPCTLGGLDTPAALRLLAQTLGDIRLTNDPRGAETLVEAAGGHPTALRMLAAWLAVQPRMSLSEAAARLRAASAAPFAPSAPEPAGPPGPSAPAGRTTAAADREARDRTGAPRAASAQADRGAQAPAPRKPAPSARPGAPSSAADGPSAGVPAPAGAATGGGEPSASPPPELVRAFRLVYASLPTTAARMLRLAVLAPAGRLDAQVASALAGCSVAAARGTLDDFVAGALLHGGPEERRPYRVPGCLEPMLRALTRATDRPEDLRLARARMLERTVRLLHACRAALAGEAPDDGLPRSLRFAGRAEAARWLETRRPALLAAARAAVADGELDTLARRLVAALVRALTAAPGGGAPAAERYELHSLILDVAERRGLHREKAAALINLADLDVETGRGDRALVTYRQALDAARAGDDTEAEGRVLEALGGGYLERGDLPRACDWFGRALALRQGRGELAHQARLHARIGAVLTYLGRYGPALREWRSAAGAHRRLGDLPSQARALAEAARVQEYAGHPEDALRTCRDALYWARQAGERRLEAAVLLRLADTLDRLGDHSGAALQRTAADRLLRRGGPPA